MPGVVGLLPPLRVYSYTEVIQRNARHILEARQVRDDPQGPYTGDETEVGEFSEPVQGLICRDGIPRVIEAGFIYRVGTENVSITESGLLRAPGGLRGKSWNVVAPEWIRYAGLIKKVIDEPVPGQVI